MKYYKLFAKRQPYFDADNGTNIGGGTETIDTSTSSTGDMSDSLFDLGEDSTGDTADTSIEDTTATDETNDDNTDAEVDQQKQVEKVKVKYNGEEIELTQEELIKNAQKGMNYDKVLSQKQALEQSEEFKVLDYFAQQNGMSRQEYVKMLIESKEQQALQNEIAAVKSQHGDIPDSIAEELAQIRIDRNNAKLAEQKAKEEKEKKDADKKMYSAFLAEYPDVKAEDIPVEVWAKVEQGQDLLTAYVRYENQQLKTKTKVVEQNNKNKDKTIGSITGDAKSDDEDPFVKGLF